MKLLSPKLAIISPCYNEELIIQESAEKLLEVIDDLVRKEKVHPESYIYFVDDGSQDQTWSLIEKLHSKYAPRIRALKLSRNFGQENAVIAGLTSTQDKADCFITINSDLQDDLAVIEKFIDGFARGYEAIYGVKRNAREDSWYKRHGTSLFNFLVGLLGIPNHSDLRFASRRVIQALMQLGEVNIFLSGLFPWLGFKTKTIPYMIHERTAGKSKYSFRMLIDLAWDGITSFSILPLRFVTVVGSILVAVAVIVFLLIASGVILSQLTIWLVAVVIFVGGLQMFGLGIVGEYIGKIYKETKARPRFIKDVELF